MLVERERWRPGMPRGGTPFSSPIVAGVLALIFALQSFVALGASAAHFARRGDEASIVISVQDVTCFVDAHGGNRLPAHEGDHAQCCVLCGARDLAGHALTNVAQMSGAISPQRFSATVSGWLREALVSPPTGWTSSWSSRAPPFFS